MKEVLDISQCPEFVLLLQIILFVDLVWMLAWSFHDLYAPMAGWKRGFRGLFEDRSAYPSPRFFSLSSCCREEISAVIWSAWINSRALHCSHWVSEQPLLWLHLVQRRPIWYSMICEDVPRQCLKFLPLGSTFSCNGQILPAQATQESPCMWRKAKKSEVEGPVSSGSTLLYYTCYCRTLSFEAITEGLCLHLKRSMGCTWTTAAWQGRTVRTQLLLGWKLRYGY